jgi:hypothetical protein
MHNAHDGGLTRFAIPVDCAVAFVGKVEPFSQSIFLPQRASKKQHSP